MSLSNFVNIKDIIWNLLHDIGGPVLGARGKELLLSLYSSTFSLGYCVA